MSADAAVAREAAVALNEQATTEMETKCEAVAAAAVLVQQFDSTRGSNSSG